MRKRCRSLRADVRAAGARGARQNRAELATGTPIAKHIVRYADHIEAIDASQEMIEQAKQGVKSMKLYFFGAGYVPICPALTSLSMW